MVRWIEQIPRDTEKVALQHNFFFFPLEEKLGGITMARKDEAFRHRRYEMFINTGGISFPFITAAPHTARITIRSDASFRVQPCQ